MFQKGQIKNYNATRGFGFIRPEDGGKDLFFHICDFPTGHAPRVAERVSYWIEQKGDKLAAKNITRLDAVTSEIPPVHEWQIQPTALSKHLKANHSNLSSSGSETEVSQAKPSTAKPVYSASAQSSRKHQQRSKPFGRIIGLAITFVLVLILGRWGFGYFQMQHELPAQQSDIEKIALHSVDSSQARLYAAIQAPPRIQQPPANTTQVTNTTNYASSNLRCDGRTRCSQMHSRAEAEWFVRNCPNTQMDGDGDLNPCENDSRW